MSSFTWKRPRAATPMSNGGCKVMRTDRSWPRRTTARARPIRYPRTCAPLKHLGTEVGNPPEREYAAAQHSEWPAVLGMALEKSGTRLIGTTG
jgi:hypothetical protein